MSTKSNSELGASTSTDDINEYLQRNPVLGAVPVNSQQRWQANSNSASGQRAPGFGAVLGGALGNRQIEDFASPSEIRRGVRAQFGLPAMGAAPGTDIRSPADKGEAAPGAQTNNGLTPESDWRAIFGAKLAPGFSTGESPGAISTIRGTGASKTLSSIYGTGSSNTPKLGMHSVMAGLQAHTNLLHSLTNGA